MMKRAGAAAVALAALALSCGPDNSLSGSVGELFDLGVSRVEVARNADALQVTYVRNRGVYTDVVVRVSVAVGDVAQVEGATIQLGGYLDGGVARCVVTHAPGGEPVRTFAPVRRGDLVVQQGGEVGELTRGNFSMSFADLGGDLGWGRTLSGTFLGRAVDAGFGELP